MTFRDSGRLSFLISENTAKKLGRLGVSRQLDHFCPTFVSCSLRCVLFWRHWTGQIATEASLGLRLFRQATPLRVSVQESAIESQTPSRRCPTNVHRRFLSSSVWLRLTADLPPGTSLRVPTNLPFRQSRTSVLPATRSSASILGPMPLPSEAGHVPGRVIRTWRQFDSCQVHVELRALSSKDSL